MSFYTVEESSRTILARITGSETATPFRMRMREQVDFEAMIGHSLLQLITDGNSENSKGLISRGSTHRAFFFVLMRADRTKNNGAWSIEDCEKFMDDHLKLPFEDVVKLITATVMIALKLYNKKVEEALQGSDGEEQKKLEAGESLTQPET